MYINNNNGTTSPSFGRFIKVKAKQHEIKELKKQLISHTDKFIAIRAKKDSDKSILYIFSKKHIDKLIKNIKKMNLVEFKSNIEKNMGEKPENITLKEAYRTLIHKNKN